MKSTNTSAGKAAKDSNTLVTVTEVAEQVGREILESQLEPAAWATALYESGGKRQDALALYARLRVRQLTQQRRIRLAKVRSFESRRLTHCMGDKATRELIAKTIQEMLESPKKGKSQNFMKPKLSIVWLSVLFMGTAGTIASLGRLFSASIPESLAHRLPLIALLAGAGFVGGAILLRYLLPKRWVMLGWNTGMVFACNVVCLCSLFLGTKVIKRAIATDTVVFPIPHVSATPARTAAVKPERLTGPYLVSTPTPKERPGN